MYSARSAHRCERYKFTFQLLPIDRCKVFRLPTIASHFCIDAASFSIIGAIIAAATASNLPDNNREPTDEPGNYPLCLLLLFGANCCQSFIQMKMFSRVLLFLNASDCRFVRTLSPLLWLQTVKLPYYIC